jgi:hypothetical protein
MYILDREHLHPLDFGVGPVGRWGVARENRPGRCGNPRRGRMNLWVRHLAVVSPDRVAPMRTGPKMPGDPKSYKYDELTLTGIDPGYGEVVQKIYADFNKQHGTDYKPLLKFAPPPGVPLDQ